MKTVKSVLVAEDDENDVFLLRRALLKAKLVCNVMHVPNGQEATEYLSGFPPYTRRCEHPFPSLLVTDLSMPLMDGFELLRWLQGQAHLSALPAIVLSASALEEDRSNALGLCALDYYVKPLVFDGLVEVVKQWSRFLLTEEAQVSKLPNGQSC